VTHAPSSVLPTTAQALGLCAAPNEGAPNTALGDAALRDAALGDAALVRRVLAGDAEAFGPIIERHYARCLRLAVHLLGDRADAEDAVRDPPLRAYRHLAGYREQDRFGAWLARILVNQCRTARARARAADRALDPPQQVVGPHQGIEPRPGGRHTRLYAHYCRPPRNRGWPYGH
jgi:hypothetical protein